MGSDYQFADINNGRAALKGRSTSEALSRRPTNGGDIQGFRAPANRFHLNRSRGDRSVKDRRVFMGLRFLHECLDWGTARSLLIGPFELSSARR